MEKKLELALDKVEMTYSQINQIADELIAQYISDINNLINSATQKPENLTNDDLRSLMLRLSLKAYSFCEIKEKSVIKAECAEMLRKEAYAKSFVSQEGSVALKDSNALISTSEEVVVEAVYDLVASLFKVKLEEIRRLIDTLKTILMSRLSEAKLSSSLADRLE